MITILKPYYDILGVDSNSTKADIKKAYKKKFRELRQTNLNREKEYKDELHKLTLAFNILYFNKFTQNTHEDIRRKNVIENLKDIRLEYFEMMFVSIVIIFCLLHTFFRVFTSHLNTMMIVFMEVPVIILISLFIYEGIYKNYKSITKLNDQLKVM